MLNTKVNHFLGHSCVILAGVFIALNLLSVGNFSYAFSGSGNVNNNSKLIIFQDELYSDEVEFNAAPEYSENVMKMKVKYEEKFIKIIGNRLDNVADNKLEQIVDKIDMLLENIKEKNNASIEQKEKIIAQLLALKEILLTTMSYEEYSIDIDLDEILEI